MGLLRISLFDSTLSIGFIIRLEWKPVGNRGGTECASEYSAPYKKGDVKRSEAGLRRVVFGPNLVNFISCYSRGKEVAGEGETRAHAESSEAGEYAS
ncbi:unnamed protein product [Chondrus crispus]|uniref:Uncharacterized protein n=1 Tax=Chondrus crispus TaxID=2769 RepID=R7QGW5_CHOCR|nr:unnamed protein product [Chondrus crispus]CDF37767.1 unnamed protein product [Chondrus crispus]|eukprot:XP_005717638.1 unnamed protein product [Chondrus crispus]